MKEYLYATGKIRVTWDEMQKQDSPFEVTISRNINKISIEKISVNWSNENYDSREFRIKKIYLSDVPRTYIENCNAVTVKGSGVEATEIVDAAYLFGSAITDIPAGTYSVTVTAYAYVGETAIKGKSYTYNTVTVAADGTVTLA